MYFTYCLEYINYEHEPKTELGLLQAESYTEAMELIINHYGEEDIEEITYLAPFTDNSVVVLDEAALSHIRDNEYNSF